MVFNLTFSNFDFPLRGKPRGIYPLVRIKLGIFVNADEIERTLIKEGKISLYKYRFKSDTKTLRNYIKTQGMSPDKLEDLEIYKAFKVRENRVHYTKKVNSYIAADIAGFIRSQLLKKGKNFSFETVFSHESKLAIMCEAKRLGFRVYLYFITTDDPDININRVRLRVAKKGHPVPPDKIVDRYYKSLGLLYDAVKLSDRAYLFDNSGRYYELVTEIENGKNVEFFVSDNQLPNWFIEHIYKKVIL